MVDSIFYFYNIMLLGVRFQVSANALLPMSDADRDKARDLLKRPYFAVDSDWRREVSNYLNYYVVCIQELNKNVLVAMSNDYIHEFTNIYIVNLSQN